jgi:predicted DNA-binding protein
MTEGSTTTIRVGIEQRDRLRRLAEDSGATMADTLDAALESLRRQRFYEAMAQAEDALRADGNAWENFAAERDAWLNPDISRQ